MAGKIVVKVQKKHIGKYVVFRGFNSTKIVAFDKNPGKAIEKARKKGVKKPVILFIPDPKKTYIYKRA